MVTQIKSALAVAFTALSVAPALLSPNVARADEAAPGTCPCNDKGQFHYIAQMAPPLSTCDTFPEVDNQNARVGAAIRFDIISASASSRGGPAGGPSVSSECVTNLGPGNKDNRGSTDLSPTEAYVCIAEIMKACRDAGF
jgi:hypothetical protein